MVRVRVPALLMYTCAPMRAYVYTCIFVMSLLHRSQLRISYLLWFRCVFSTSGFVSVCVAVLFSVSISVSASARPAQHLKNKSGSMIPKRVASVCVFKLLQPALTYFVTVQVCESIMVTLRRRSRSIISIAISIEYIQFIRHIRARLGIRPALPFVNAHGSSKSLF